MLDHISRSATPGVKPAARPSELTIFDSIPDFVDFIIRSLRLVAVSVGLALTVAILYVLIATPIFTARAQLLINVQQPSLFREQSNDARFLQDRFEIQNHVALLESDQIALIAAKNVNLLPAATGTDAAGSAANEQQLRQVIASFQDGLDVRRAKESYIIEIYYRSKNPETAALFANAAADAYIEDQLATRSEAARQGSQWLEERIDQLRTQMNVASLKAQEVRAKRDYRLAPRVEGSSPASDKAETGVAKAPQNTLEELESTALTYRKIYENYVQAHTESVLRQSYPIANARVISRAAPPLTKSSPKVARSLLAAIVLGGMFGFGIALLREAIPAMLRRDREPAMSDPQSDLLPLSHAQPARNAAATRRHHMRVWRLLSVALLRSIVAAHRVSVDMVVHLLSLWNDRKRHLRSFLTRAQRTCASWSWLIVPILVVGLLVVPRSGGLAGPVGSSDYTLGSLDKIRLKVFEWRASRDEIFEWTAFNAEYTVGAGGKISLPLIGDMAAAGKSPTELSQAIGQALRTRIGLAEPPSISVEVVQFRPFYIVGDVERPGEYAYRPGLTLLQAITIAGGMPRAKNLSPARLERESISTRGDLRLLEGDLVATMARKARLTSELQASDEIAIPDELNASATDTSSRAIINQETVLFQSRKEAFATQVRALEQLKAQHEMEATSLVKQLEMHDNLIDLLKPELDAVQELYQKQLVTAPRKLALERNATQLQGDRLRLETALARARQEASKTEIAIIELQNRRSTEINAELRQSQARLNEIGERIETAQRLLYETEVSAPRLLAVRSRLKETQPAYSVVRVISGRAVELEANDATQIEPGDTIKIEFPHPGDAVELREARQYGPHLAGSWSEKR